MGNITNAGVPITIGDKKLEYQDLNIEDYDWLENWVRSKYILAGRQSIPSGASEKEEDQIMQSFIKAAMEVDIFDNRFSKHLGTLSGLVRAHWCALRHKNPDLELDWVIDQCNDHEVMRALSTAKREISLLIKKPKKSPPDEKTQPKSSTGRRSSSF